MFSHLFLNSCLGLSTGYLLAHKKLDYIMFTKQFDEAFCKIISDYYERFYIKAKDLVILVIVKLPWLKGEW